MRRAALIAMLSAAAPAMAQAQPMDPYAPPKSAAPPKAPKAPKAKPKTPPAGPVDPYGDAPAVPAGPQDPYGGAPATPPGPQDPYAQPTAPAPTPPAPTPPTPAPPPAPVADQPSDIDEAVAAALVTRAHHLIDVQAWADAKQLAVESLVRSPNGASAADAKEIVRVANQHLGIVDEPPKPPEPVDTTTKPVTTPTEPGVAAHAEVETRGTTVLTGYGIAGGAMLGLGVVGAGDGVSGAGADTAGAIIGGLAGGGLAYWLGDSHDVTFTQARTVGSGMTWGALEFAFLTDAVGGTNVHTTHDEITVGSSIGLALGTLGGIAYAKDGSLSAGDVTLVDSFAGMGVIGGYTVGEIMQPYASEAYSLNAAIGAAAGVAVGLYLAPDTEISSARMLRVDGVAAAGAAAPWLIYAAVRSPDTHADERVFGLLSTAGLLGGLWLGFHWTRDYDEKHLASEHDKKLELGALSIRPPTTPLARDERAGGLVVDFARGSF